ncbi:hypothetical protein AURDEDRAFT_128033 [Auricularia subglabra TFB-10046 SS5]|nr:hypothetical protein AURDEDRAFT_128033 [Auricularia subglabra TFB-10046 SS5]
MRSTGGARYLVPAAAVLAPPDVRHALVVLDASHARELRALLGRLEWSDARRPSIVQRKCGGSRENYFEVSSFKLASSPLLLPSHRDPDGSVRPRSSSSFEFRMSAIARLAARKRRASRRAVSDICNPSNQSSLEAVMTVDAYTPRHAASPPLSAASHAQNGLLGLNANSSSMPDTGFAVSAHTCSSSTTAANASSGAQIDSPPSSEIAETSHTHCAPMFHPLHWHADDHAGAPSMADVTDTAVTTGAHCPPTVQLLEELVDLLVRGGTSSTSYVEPGTPDLDLLKLLCHSNTLEYALAADNNHAGSTAPSWPSAKAAERAVDTCAPDETLHVSPSTPFALQSAHGNVSRPVFAPPNALVASAAQGEDPRCGFVGASTASMGASVYTVPGAARVHYGAQSDHPSEPSTADITQNPGTAQRGSPFAHPVLIPGSNNVTAPATSAGETGGAAPSEHPEQSGGSGLSYAAPQVVSTSMVAQTVPLSTRRLPIYLNNQTGKRLRRSYVKSQDWLNDLREECGLTARGESECAIRRGG